MCICPAKSRGHSAKNRDPRNETEPLQLGLLFKAPTTSLNARLVEQFVDVGSQKEWIWMGWPPGLHVVGEDMGWPSGAVAKTPIPP